MMQSSPSPFSEVSAMSRRRFLQWMMGGITTVWGVLALYPIYRYLRPSNSRIGPNQVTRVTVGPSQAISVGQGQNFQFGSIPGIVTHTASGFHAFNATCTHLGCTVQFRPDMGKIWCACHGGVYDPNTGQVLAGPPPRPLQPLQVVVQAGNIVVSQG